MSIQYLIHNKFCKSIVQRQLIMILVLMNFISNDLNGQSLIKGQIKLDSTWSDVAYLSDIPDLDKMYDIASDMIIQSADIDERGQFYFKTDYLSQEDHFYRVHFVKKGDPPVSLSIGGKDENHFFLIANNKSNILISNNSGNSLLNEITFSGYYPNQALMEINEMLVYIDSVDFEGLTIKKEFLLSAVNDKLRYYADTCTIPMVSLYALYKSKFESNYPVNQQFYKNYLKKWKNKQSPYYKAFRAELDITHNKKLFDLILTGIALFVLGIVVSVLFRRHRGKNNNLIKSLSVQERKIFSLLKEGKSNKEISEEFNIGLSTVKSHVNNIYTKLNINSRKEGMNFGD